MRGSAARIEGQHVVIFIQHLRREPEDVREPIQASKRSNGAKIMDATPIENREALYMCELVQTLECALIRWCEERRVAGRSTADFITAWASSRPLIRHVPI